MNKERQRLYRTIGENRLYRRLKEQYGIKDEKASKPEHRDKERRPLREKTQT